MMRAAVFAYHNVGVRCLRVLHAGGVEIPLVVTHEDRPEENIWFDSVARTAGELDILAITPPSPAAPELLQLLEQLNVDTVFSFYYRHMLPPPVLALGRLGAFNMHGSLLPKYRGRVPVNWAILDGATETGATLHEMVAKPDAGAIVDQTAVPILPDDTALDVFQKVTVAAEQTLWRCLPGLIAGTAARRFNDIEHGSYFGARRPEDGAIDWGRKASDVYNLVRAVAPPYPGAYALAGGRQFIVASARLAHRTIPGLEPGLVVRDNQILGVCGDGGVLLIRQLTYNGRTLEAADLAELLQKP